MRVNRTEQCLETKELMISVGVLWLFRLRLLCQRCLILWEYICLDWIQDTIFKRYSHSKTKTNTWRYLLCYDNGAMNRMNTKRW